MFYSGFNHRDVRTVVFKLTYLAGKVEVALAKIIVIIDDDMAVHEFISTPLLPHILLEKSESVLSHGQG